MKAHMYILIATLAYLSGLFTEIEQPVKEEFNSKTKNLQGYSDLLTSDYKRLTRFSENLKEYGITEESFENLFWEGLSKSRNFYSSSDHMGQSSVNHWIEKELLNHVDLYHPLEKPETLQTNSANAFSALHSFSGEWHGTWETMKVNHLWLSVQRTKNDLTDGFSIVGFQSCFTGDGFGWNYVVKEQNEIVILGFVYHFDDTGNITARNPHYAFVNTKHQLTWVSDNHIYYEFVCRDSKCGDKKHYVITGGQYEKRIQRTNLTSGFQAVYVSESLELPAFKHLYLNRVNRAKKLLSRKLETRIQDYLQKGFSM